MEEKFNKFKNKCESLIKSDAKLGKQFIEGPSGDRALCIISDYMKLKDVGELMKNCDEEPHNYSNLYVDSVIKLEGKYSSVTCQTAKTNEKSNIQPTEEVKEWMRSIGY
jgi:hypothetical protein